MIDASACPATLEKDVVVSVLVVCEVVVMVTEDVVIVVVGWPTQNERTAPAGDGDGSSSRG